MFRYSGNGLLAKEKVRFHPTQKPVALIEWCLDQAKDAVTVYDPFSGSGSTLIAVEQTGRRCFAIEISPAYVDVAVRRWQNHTGQRAILEATGEAFPEAPQPPSS
jgi:DNA modification methylase